MKPLISFCALALFALAGVSLAQKPQLHIMHAYSNQPLARIFEDFARQHQLSSHIEFFEQNDIKTNLLKYLELGQAPDIVLQPADHLGLYEFTRYSVIDPTKLKVKLSERMWESALSDGTLYGVPVFQGNHLMMYYNKALIDTPAADWTAMLKHQAILQKQGLGTISWSYGEPFWFLPFYGAFGGWPIENGEVSLNTPAMAAALDFYRNLNKQELPAANCSYDCTKDLFKQGKVAYTINGEWTHKEFHEALGDKLGVAAIPKAEGRPVVPTFATHVLAFPNGSLEGRNSAVLHKLIEHMLSPEIQQQLWDKVGAIPVEAKALAQAQASATDYRKEMLSLMDQTRALPSDPAMTFIWDALGKGFVRHQEGAIDAVQAAKLMQSLADRHIRKSSRYAKSDRGS